jgi:hypothetical protein
MMQRRAFLGSTLSTVGLSTCSAQSATAAQIAVGNAQPQPLVWPLATKPAPDVRSFVGHTDTVLDVIGRIGARQAW